MAEGPSPPLAPNLPTASIETLLATVVARFDGLDARVNGLGTRLDGLDTRVERLGARLDGLDMRVERLGARLDGLDARLDRVEKRSNVLIGLLGALIVAMITADGLLWSAIVSSERSLRQEIVQLEVRLGDRITALDGRVMDLERGLVERIHNLELAFVRSGIELRGGGDTPPGQDGQRSEREVSPGAGPAEPDAPRPGALPDQAE